MPGSLTIVSEDAPSELLAELIVRYVDPEATITNRLGKQGIGFIAHRLRALNEAARGMRILVIADRDRAENCPIQMIQEWIGGPQHLNLVVRLAEMETEAWIIADRDRLAEFLEIPVNRIPQNPDTLQDAKEALVNLARLSRSSRVRDDMCPLPHAAARVGPAYNQRLDEFLRTRWRAQVAARQSPSLDRAQRRIRELCMERPGLY
ncbi:hypothetical protein [uncultured Brevundimonas sp.]|uniref:hypothetical protein n=1 Tax=uncultured Brevundimonas sp. TaxID=213418 RepID=UPI0030EC8B55|tara:strand:+ start:2973 stop:3590 length:618 start_codon:yes stop_codon:yes gene_type:complete